ncbi:hypothetical protein HSR122_2333 [Halapricum desulfuricans]|uniref:Uncharacterized protein n=1 Tax=Halapricum desulfuricans TaxID=2841257 RepID=A0A897NBE3_9EURY|nr:hypothetical protein HSR122_2333 [Halapricum desulfuricans]
MYDEFQNDVPVKRHVAYRVRRESSVLLVENRQGDCPRNQRGKPIAGSRRFSFVLSATRS